MNKSQIITIFTQDQRRDTAFPGYKKEILPHVVRHFNISGTDGGFITWSDLDESNVDQVIGQQITWFEAQGQDFEWKYYDYDQPLDLKDRLAAFGFEIEDAEAVMVLPIADVPEALMQPVSSAVVKLTSPEQLVDVRRIKEAVWNEDSSWVTTDLAREMVETPEEVSVYVAYVDGKPASSARVNFTPGSCFGSLWGGSTISEYRKRGLYTALLAARAQEAKARGVDFLTVDASPMSRPILEKFGFQKIAISHPCKWKHNDK